jgi:hypothetical protein
MNKHGNSCCWLFDPGCWQISKQVLSRNRGRYPHSFINSSSVGGKGIGHLQLEEVKLTC